MLYGTFLDDLSSLEFVVYDLSLPDTLDANHCLFSVHTLL